MTELLALRDEQRARKRKMGECYHDLDLVFCQPNGKPLYFHNLIREDFREVLKAAKVPQVRFHDLRHSAASLLLTLDTYSHTVDSLARDAVADLGSLLLPQSKGAPV